MADVHRLHQLGDARRHEHVAVGEGHHRRVPAAVGHVAGGGPGVAGGVEDARVAGALELDHAGLHGRAGDVRVGVVVGAADREQPPVGELDEVGAEQRRVVVVVRVGVVQRRGEQRVGGVLGARGGAHRVGQPPARLALEVEDAGLVVDRDDPVLGHDRVLHVLGRLERVEEQDLAVGQDRHRAGRGLAVEVAGLVGEADLVGGLGHRLAGVRVGPGDDRLGERVTEGADLAWIRLGLCRGGDGDGRDRGDGGRDGDGQAPAAAGCEGVHRGCPSRGSPTGPAGVRSAVRLRDGRTLRVRDFDRAPLPSFDGTTESGVRSSWYPRTGAR